VPLFGYCKVKKMNKIETARPESRAAAKTTKDIGMLTIAGEVFSMKNSQLYFVHQEK